MTLQKSYDEYYFQERNRSIESLAEESLSNSIGLYNYACEMKERFLKDIPWNELEILETGAGRGGVGLYLAQRGAKITLLDFSLEALEQAKSIYLSRGFSVRTLQGDVSHPDLHWDQRFDLIVDSHLLHCLALKPDRVSYYRLIKDHLKKHGFFLAETMVHRKKIFIPDGFKFDENYILWQKLGDWVPVRKIIDSLDLEDELKRSGFHIDYFYYYGQLGFVPHKHFLDLPTDILPAAVRFAISCQLSLK